MTSNKVAIRLTITFLILTVLIGGLFIALPIIISGRIAHVDCLENCVDSIPPLSSYYRKAAIALLLSAVVGGVPYLIVRQAVKHKKIGNHEGGSR